MRAMSGAPRVVIEAPLEARARFLRVAYSDLQTSRGGLVDLLEGLRPLRGRALVETWQEQARAGEWEALAACLMQHHYDPAYARARDAGAPAATVRAERLDGGDLPGLADRVMAALAQVE